MGGNNKDLVSTEEQEATPAQQNGNYTKPKSSTSRNSKPYVNDYDLVESMPGAQCDCTGPQRAEFVARAKKLYEVEKKEEAQMLTQERERQQLQAEQEVDTLVEMFPFLEKTLLQGLYLEHGMQAATEQAIILSATLGQDSKEVVAKATVGEEAASSSTDVKGGEEADFFSAEARAARKKELVVTDNAENWPPLTDADGWQVYTAPVELDDLAVDNSDNTWSNVAKAAADLPSPRPQLEELQQAGINPRTGLQYNTGANYRAGSGVNGCGATATATGDYDYYAGHRDAVDDYDLARSRAIKNRDQMAIHHKARPRKDSSATTAASEDGAAEDEHYTTGEMVEVDVA